MNIEEISHDINGNDDQAVAEIQIDKDDENKSPTKKITRRKYFYLFFSAKRNPFEKALDDSIKICDNMIEKVIIIFI